MDFLGGKTQLKLTVYGVRCTLVGLDLTNQRASPNHSARPASPRRHPVVVVKSHTTDHCCFSSLIITPAVLLIFNNRTNDDHTKATRNKRRMVRSATN